MKIECKALEFAHYNFSKYVIEYLIVESGLIHSENEPAIKLFEKYTSGNICLIWCKNGLIQREDGPAIEYIGGNCDGNKEWWLNHERHRKDGPAIISRSHEEWIIHGKHHREDGPAIKNSIYESWWINGQCHREDGPAYIEGGVCKYVSRWQFNGMVHREDGPAVEWANGDKEYYLFDKRIKKRNFTPKNIATIKLSRIIET